MPLFVYGATITVVALLALLLAERAGSTRRIWVAKPLASTGFVLAAWGAGALTTRYGQIVLVALALSWLGDVLLIPKARLTFLAGLVSFLLGHVAFAAAFWLRGAPLGALGLALLVLAVPSGFTWRWLRPYVDSAMRVPVATYVAVITLMVALALATTVQHGGWLVLAGAVAFYLSDLAVARDRFVAEGFANRLWGLPLYYGAQLLLAASTGWSIQ